MTPITTLVSLLAYSVKKGPKLIKAHLMKHPQEKYCGMKTRQSLSKTMFPICVFFFDSLSQSLEQDSSETNINNNLKKFSDSLYSCSDAHFGTNICAENSSSPIKENRWFDNECCSAKREFNSAKRQFSHNRSEQNRTNFIICRTKFDKIKRKAKAKFKRNEGLKISKLAKSNPKSFWKKINKFVRKNKSESDSLSAGNFF